MSDAQLEQPRVGDYAIDRLRGEGGMGQVYEATASDGTRVALKLVKSDLARDETLRRRFQREARIAQTVRHPNVVPVIATGEHEGRPYMAQRFIDGIALDEAQRTATRPASAVGIGADVAAGWRRCGRRWFIATSSSANILLDEHGQAYITDFGAKDTGKSLTPPDQALGSMDYGSEADPRRLRHPRLPTSTPLAASPYECLCG
jgi:serine/threonine-protein kinase